MRHKCNSPRPQCEVTVEPRLALSGMSGEIRCPRPVASRHPTFPVPCFHEGHVSSHQPERFRAARMQKSYLRFDGLNQKLCCHIDIARSISDDRVRRSSKAEAIQSCFGACWIASRSLSSGARDPLARNDVERSAETSPPSLRGALATKQSSLPLRFSGLLRGARNDDGAG
jgi:hypothetical protein